MRTRELGSTGKQVAVVGQGTWLMERDPGESVSALRRGIELGMTHIDTAEMYGSGEVEKIVGKAIRGVRDSLYLVSKVLPENASYREVLKACDRSLVRLGVDHLDLLLLHWPSSHPLDGTIGAFEQLRQEGKIGAFGVSNFDAALLERAVALAGAGRIACNQVYYQLEVRTIEHDVLPLCERNKVAVVGYSPFGRNRFRADHPILSAIADAHRVTTRQVALAYLIRRDSLFTIPKASRISHVEENAGAGNLVLDEAEISAIEDAFPRGPRRRHLPTL